MDRFERSISIMYVIFMSFFATRGIYDFLWDNYLNLFCDVFAVVGSVIIIRIMMRSADKRNKYKRYVAEDSVGQFYV